MTLFANALLKQRRKSMTLNMRPLCPNERPSGSNSACGEMLLLAAFFCIILVAACLLLTLLRKLLLDVEFLENYISGIHYGLVEMGGFRRMGAMTPQQRHYMCVREHSNIECHTTMGPEIYMQSLCGIESETHSAEEAEEEKMERDPVITTIPASRRHVLDRLRSLLRECLDAKEFAHAAAVEQAHMSALTWEPYGEVLERTDFENMLREVLATLQTRLRRANMEWRCPMTHTLRAYVCEFQSLLGSR